MNTHLIIGITGGSGSGKTSLIQDLRRRFDPTDVCILSQDNYYRKREEQHTDDQGVKNFDLPESFMMNEFVADFHKIRSGVAVERQEYTYNNALAKSGTIRIEPASVLVVEGLFLFHLEELKAHINLSVLVDANDVLKLKRRILRDQVERNYPLEDVLYRYEHHVLPAYRKYIEPYQSEMHLIINNDVSYQPGLDVLSTYIHAHIRAKVE